jgi:hypothetical protein
MIMTLTWAGAVERATGIEPALPAWKAGALPLSYARGAAVFRCPVAYRLTVKADTRLEPATGFGGSYGSAPFAPAVCRPGESISPSTLGADRVGFGWLSGMWRSLVSAPALGAGGPRFESGHPDREDSAHVPCPGCLRSEGGSMSN